MTDQNRDVGNDQMPRDGMGRGPEDMSHGMGRGGPAGEGGLKGSISDTRDPQGQPDMTGPEGKRSWQSVESDDDTAEANQSREEQQTPQ